MLLLRLPLTLVAVCIFGLADLPAISQRLVPAGTSSWQLAWYAGPTTYAGDREAEILDRGQFGFWYGGEVSHSLTRVLGIGIKLNTLSHPRLVSSEQYRSSLAVVLRATQTGSSVFSPFVEAGVHFLVGAGRGGSGPVIGTGLNVRVTRSLSVFTAVDVNLVYPGDVLDGSADADHFDGLIAGRLGLRVTDIKSIFSNKANPEIGSIDTGPVTTAGELARLSVILDHSDPTDVITWEFGDGQTGLGNPVQHVFLEPGVYGGTVRVSSRNGETWLPFTIAIGGSLPTAAIPDPSSAPDNDAWLDLSGVEIYHPRSRAALTTTPPPVVEEPETPIERVATDNPGVITGYAWVVASRDNLAEARSVAAGYLSASLDVRIIPATIRGTVWYRIVLGLFDTRQEAVRNISNLPAEAPSDSWVVELSNDTPVPLVPTSEDSETNR